MKVIAYLITWKGYHYLYKDCIKRNYLAGIAYLYRPLGMSILYTNFMPHILV